MPFCNVRQIKSGYETSNLFWPGEQDAQGRVYTCTYHPMVILVNETRLLAMGGCTPAGCSGVCNGLHINLDRVSASCTMGCLKYSDDGGKTWSKIRAFTKYDPAGFINYDRVNKRVLLQFPDGAGLYTKHPGAVLQITSDDFGQTWSDPVDISAMLGPSFSPGKQKY